MIRRCIYAIGFNLAVAGVLCAQLSRDSKFEILRKVIAEQAASRVVMPHGSEGVEVEESGEVDQKKLEKELRENGRAIEEGQVVQVTDIRFNDDKIEVELDGGGKKKKSFWERIEVGTGSRTVPIGQSDHSKAKGSTVTLHFSKKVPSDLTAEALKQLLDPVLDFNKRNFLKTGIDALPPEYQEAVKNKEAKIGMDRSTVLMAMGRPDKRVRERANSIEREDWIYFKPGMQAEFITFENGVVVVIKKY